MRHSLDRRYFYTAFLFIILGFSLRLCGIGRDLWLDEFSSVQLAAASDLPAALRSYDHPPLYFLFLKIIISISQNVWFMRFFSAVLGTAVIGVIIAWIKRYSREASLTAGFIASFIPPLVVFSQEIRDYSLLILMSSLAFYFAKLIIDEPKERKNYIWFSAVLSAAVSTHLIGIMLIPAAGIYGVFEKRKNMTELFSLFFSFVPPILFFLFWRYCFLTNLGGHVRGTWWIPEVSLDLVSSAIILIFGIPSMIPYFHSGAGLLAKGVSYSSSLILFFVFIMEFFRGDPKKSLPLAAAAVFYFLPVFIYSILVLPILLPRTLLPMLVPLIGFLAVHINSVNNASSRRILFAVLAVFAFSFCWRWIFYEASRPREQWRAAAGIISSEYRDGDRIILCPSYISDIFRFYYDGSGNEKIDLLRLGSLSNRSEIIENITKAAEIPFRGRLFVVNYLGKNLNFCKTEEGTLFRRISKGQKSTINELMRKGPLFVSRVQIR